MNNISWNPTQKTLLVMAGGTGGHIFPALTVGKHLQEEGWRVVWFGNPDSMEARLACQSGFEMIAVRFAALRGKGWKRKFMLPFALIRAVWQSMREIRIYSPDVALGMGGYISFPGSIAAKLLGIPLVIHEQNSIAGLANRVLSKVANRTLTGFPNVLKKGICVGNPIRSVITQVPPPEERMAGREGVLKLLVVGGSLGAKVLNDIIPQGLLQLSPELMPEVVHQSGTDHLTELEDNYREYREKGGVAHCVDFIEDMASAYAWADLVICRSGALTVFELAAIGVASVLVPLPHAVDDHQTGNAHYLTLAGGAFFLPQADLTPESVALLGNYKRGQLLEMAKKARELARPDATLAVVNVCKALAK
ncbi:MAG: undecaprenyldiphospho-muramoylpentapeptide beta-N-acetylglucosaminyltransferase [Zoogloeaceae bacterium]|nr:undecaprenyldiphospho-muramoylpentapeptide beta-N-acetylglucosaminyltransferase [Zoogloeaceae bacterium]